jgi:hypothetical protein
MNSICKPYKIPIMANPSHNHILFFYLKKAMIIPLLVLMFHGASAQSELRADQEQILNQCLSFQPLIEKIPLEVQKELSTYFILDHGVAFHFSSKMTVNNKPVALISKQEIDKRVPYFLFHTLNIEKEQALVRYYFIYTNEGSEITLPVVLEFVKKDSKWEISTYSK